MEQFVIDMLLQSPSLTGALVIMGLLRAVFKPIFSVAEAYVKETKDPSDDAKLAKIMESKPYKIVAWLLDYTASIKVPVKK